MNAPAITVIAIAADATRGADQPRRKWESMAGFALRGAAAFWIAMAAVGQVLFAVYVVGFYGRAAAQGHPEFWNKVLTTGYVSGDTVGNAALVAHLSLAVIITSGGFLQLIPFVRRRWPRFHRWNGRVFMVSAVAAAAAGLLMIWTRPSAGDLSQSIGISLSAALIFAFAGLALRHALARRFDIHRRWAIRLFLVVNTGWFFRVGLMLWLVVNRGPVGFDPKTFTGPFLSVLSFADYLLPLVIAELYFRTQQSRSVPIQFAMAGGLALLTLAMTAGIGAAAAMMWLPHL